MSYYDNNNNNNNSYGGGDGYQRREDQGNQDQDRGLGQDENAPSQYGGGPGPYGQQQPYPGPQGSFQSGPSPSHYGQSFHQQGGPAGGPPRPGGNMVGGSQYGGNVPGGGYSQEELEQHEKSEKYKDWGKKAGIAALGAATIGAVAYGVHEYREHKEDEEEEEEAKRRREEDERRRHEEEKRRQQQQQHQGGGYSPSQDSGYGGYQQQQQRPPHYGGGNDGGFVPPAPFGRPAYSFDQNDVRNADPSRSSDNSPTPRQYPQLRHNDGDTVMKIGSVISLKHNMTGRFLHTDRSHGTQTGSNQQLVYGYRWNPDQNDWWQVLPANHDVPVPGSVVAYGTQIRLRHLETGRHLHSHYNFHDKSGQNEVTAYGDEGFSDENDHWVVERWGEGAYGQTWGANDAIVLRHYVSGMTLHSHEILISEDVQSVTCFGPGREENDKWRVHLH
ncbi:hypothetical protein IW140_003088 [Coemansia sp. RSA 1813]|nr:hypothetical protein LPJ74_005514 [Coemansia sp. RSA 1843]KAJ2089527.1 hypothetical protein IW138_003416 [Coemansia sp. RSA 986]KAJ2214503.1 hypothetical protein EV179_002908 [Coemansia sp. RSA 487]KAJ2569385.1 hypothetical protein IW140_003088 [Coemansia sp. RSA 1813]